MRRNLLYLFLEYSWLLILNLENMRKKLGFIVLLSLGIILGACSKSDNVNFLDVQTSDENMNICNIAEYLTVEDNQWVCTISEIEAYHLGFSKNEYDKIIKDIAEINEELAKVRNNPNTTITFNFPNKKVVSKEGKQYEVFSTRTFSKPTYFFKKLIAAPYGSASFCTEQNCIGIKVDICFAPAYIHGMWMFKLIDDVWKREWVETGIGDPRLPLEKEMITSPSPPNYDIYHWLFFGECNFSSGSGSIEVSFYVFKSLVEV